MSSYRSLVSKFEKTKKELGDAENTIRRLTGRDPDDVSSSVSRSGRFRQSSSTATSSRLSYSRRKRPSYYLKKHSRGRESRMTYEDESHDDYNDDEDDEDDDESPTKKPTLQSKVVAKRHQRRSRKATIEEQNANSKIKARNRRMFGALMGTLEKFQHEEKKRQHKESMRAEIEQKVEAATEEERERIKEEKEHLFVTRREKQTQLRCLEKKIERAESHEVFDINHRYQLNYIRTRSKPPIFFLPSSHTAQTKKYLDESRSKIKELIKKRKESFECDLSEIDEWYRKDSLPGDKENKCPKEESESQVVPEIESEPLVMEKEDAGADDNESDSNNNNNNEEDASNKAKNVGSLTDQDFEPIYD